MARGLYPATVSLRIRQKRELAGISQAQLAREANVTPAAISQIESGKRTPTVPVLHKIAKVLNVSLDYLIGQGDEVEVQEIAQDADVQSFFRGFQELRKDDQERIMEQIEFLKARRGK